MTRISMYAALASVLTLTLASTANAGLADGLIVLYEFENSGNLGENSASGNAGTNVDVAQVAGGQIGNAGDWAAINDAFGARLLVNSADLSNIQFGGTGTGDGSISVSLWMKNTGNPTISSTNASATYPTAYDGSAGGGGWRSINNNYVPGNQDGNLQLNINSIGGGSTSANYSPVGDSDPSFSLHDDAWHHVAYTLERASNVTTVTLFADGVKLIGPSGENPAVSAEQANGFPLGQWVIGSDSEGNVGVRLTGKLDDYAIWNRTLSDAEITGIYDNGLLGQGIIPEPSSMLLALWGLVGLASYRSRRTC